MAIDPGVYSRAMTAPIGVEEFAEWLEDEPSSIGDGLFMLSSLLSQRSGIVENGRFALDELADSIDDASPTGIVQTLFGSGGFRGDVEDYHAEDNSFLDRVLERRLGMPITLSAVVVEVGQRVGVPLTLVGMPGHVIVGTHDEDCFIDAFGGVVVDAASIQKRFESIFGPQAVIDLSLLEPMTVISTVSRVCNNLMRSWADDRTGQMDRLLELRSRFPGTPAERGMLISAATGRGRFDIAARLREQSDPDDPEITALWARLN